MGSYQLFLVASSLAGDYVELNGHQTLAEVTTHASGVDSSQDDRAAERLSVPIVPVPDDAWTYDFGGALSNLKVETRGQQYSSARVEDGELHVEGVGLDPEVLRLTADFFDVVVAQTDGHRERESRRRLADNERLADEHEDRVAEEHAAAEELRNRD